MAFAIAASTSSDLRSAWAEGAHQFAANSATIAYTIALLKSSIIPSFCRVRFSARGSSAERFGRALKRTLRQRSEGISAEQDEIELPIHRRNKRWRIIGRAPTDHCGCRTNRGRGILPMGLRYSASVGQVAWASSPWLIVLN